MRKSLANLFFKRKSRYAVAAAIAILFVGTVGVHANGILYLIDGENLYTVNTDTGALTLIGPAYDDGLAPSGDPATLYCTDDTPDLFSLPINGNPQSYIATITGDGNRGLAYNVTTRILYGTDNLDFGSIDTTTGAFTLLDGPPDEAEALAADPINNLVYGLETGDTVTLMVYDVASNQWSVVGPTAIPNGGKAGLAYDPIDKVLYAHSRDGNGLLYSIDPITAVATFIGETGQGTSTGMAFVPHLFFHDGFELGDTSGWSSTLP
jgi:hypothetical protein